MDELIAEKILCQGHVIQKPYPCKQEDEHHGMCTSIKHGKCIITKELRNR